MLVSAGQSQEGLAAMGVEGRQKLGEATFLGISPIRVQNGLGIAGFSASFPKRVLFVPCVSRGLNRNPHSCLQLEQVVLLAVGPKGLGVLVGWAS